MNKMIVYLMEMVIILSIAILLIRLICPVVTEDATEESINMRLGEVYKEGLSEYGQADGPDIKVENSIISNSARVSPKVRIKPACYCSGKWIDLNDYIYADTNDFTFVVVGIESDCPDAEFDGSKVYFTWSGVYKVELLCKTEGRRKVITVDLPVNDSLA